MGLISLDVSGPFGADVPAARLGGAPDLVRLDGLPPTLGRLDLPPHRVAQTREGRSWRRRARGGLWPSIATVGIHVGFAAAFAYLLIWRDDVPRREIVTEVEVVKAAPEPPKPTPRPSEVPKPQSMTQAQKPPKPPEPPQPFRQEPKASPLPPDPLAALQPPEQRPRLVEPPPEPARAATQQHENKTANLEPDQHVVDQATHEARPAEVPQTLTTSDPQAAFAVAPRSEPNPDPVPRPAPAIPAKVPSAADKLAAALPMDTSGMPLTFRAVLSGNGAQISAAYKGLVYGRFNRSPEISERARRQHLKGQVVVTFSIDDMGKISALEVLQSSGNAVVDALGLDLIRAAAPFPPPPPEAQHSFTPALAFGD
jgi:protein TonB